MNDNVKVVHISGGRSSGYMAKILKDSGDEYLFIFQNTGKEDERTLHFINECDKRWKLGVIWIEYRSKNNFVKVDYKTASRNGEPFNDVIKDEKILPNMFKRFCTRKLKIETANRYLKSLDITDIDNYIGIRYDEPRRWLKKINEDNTFMPLVKSKINKQFIINWWKDQEFNTSTPDYLNNCDCCFHKSNNTLYRIYKEEPNKLKWWIDLENKHKHTFKDHFSYKKIINNKNLQIDMFDTEERNCICNID